MASTPRDEAVGLPATLPIVEFEGAVYRCHSIDYGYGFFGRAAKHRFDDPLGEFGVLYLGISREAAFVETCLRAPAAPFLTASFLAARGMIEVGLKRIRLAQVYGSGLVKLNQTSLLTSTTEDGYTVSRAFSREIFRHGDAVDGIAYISRHDNEQRSIALFDRAVGALTVPPDRKGPSLLSADWLDDMLDRYGVGFDPGT